MCTFVFPEMPRKKLILVDLVNTLGRPASYSVTYIRSDNGEILASEKSRGCGVDEKFKNSSTD